MKFPPRISFPNRLCGCEEPRASLSCGYELIPQAKWGSGSMPSTGFALGAISSVYPHLSVSTAGPHSFRIYSPVFSHMGLGTTLGEAVPQLLPQAWPIQGLGPSKLFV